MCLSSPLLLAFVLCFLPNLNIKSMKQNLARLTMAVAFEAINYYNRNLQEKKLAEMLSTQTYL